MTILGLICFIIICLALCTPDAERGCYKEPSERSGSRRSDNKKGTFDPRHLVD